MDRQPSLLQFIGIAVFTTVVAVFVAGNVPLVESFQSRMLAYLSVFAVAQTTVTYLMIQRWVEYAERNGVEPHREESTNSKPGD
ncbi:MAG: hypothetical protein V5A33_05305 [Halobacteriales archaeon]